MEADRISNLPSEIVEQILTHLPLKAAVKTSVLSNQWRYRASRLRYLVFDSYCVDNWDSSFTLANIVDHVLSVHNGPIHKFQLSGADVGTDRDFDRWILHLSQRSMKEFVLYQIRMGPRYKLPSCLFSCQELTSLELCSCLLKPPSSFKGFKSLKSIDFDGVTMAQDVFENLMTFCPLLERLRLSQCEGIVHLRIDAPNLQYLVFRGCFKDINLLNTANLVDVAIFMDDDKHYDNSYYRQGSGSSSNYDIDYHRRVCGPSSNLVKFLSCLPDHVQRLEIHGLFLMYLAIGALPGGLPKPFSQLTFLHISISLTNFEQSLTALCIVRSCPVLQELAIQVNPWHGEVVRKGNSWLDNDRKCLFSQLRRVDIKDIRDLKGEVDFVKYLLMNSPVLKRMTVKPYHGVNASKLEKKLLRYERMSASSKIIFPDPPSEEPCFDFAY